MKSAPNLDTPEKLKNVPSLTSTITTSTKKRGSVVYNAALSLFNFDSLVSPSDEEDSSDEESDDEDEEDYDLRTHFLTSINALVSNKMKDSLPVNINQINSEKQNFHLMNHRVTLPELQDLLDTTIYTNKVQNLMADSHKHGYNHSILVTQANPSHQMTRQNSKQVDENHISLIQNLGLDQSCLYTCSLDINDFPLVSRYKVLNSDLLEELRGRFCINIKYDPQNKSLARGKKFILVFEGSDKDAVQDARSEVRQLLKDDLVVNPQVEIRDLMKIAQDFEDQLHPVILTRLNAVVVSFGSVRAVVTHHDLFSIEICPEGSDSAMKFLGRRRSVSRASALKRSRYSSRERDSMIKGGDPGSLSKMSSFFSQSIRTLSVASSLDASPTKTSTAGNATLPYSASTTQIIQNATPGFDLSILLDRIRESRKENEESEENETPFEQLVYDFIFSHFSTEFTNHVSNLHIKSSEIAHVYSTKPYLSAKDLETMHILKNRFSSLTDRVEAHKACLTELINDDYRMALMNLKTAEENPALFRVSRSSMGKGVSRDGDSCASASQSSSFVSGGSSEVTLSPEMFESSRPIEILLYSHLMNIHQMEKVLEIIRVKLDHSEDSVNLRNETTANKVLTVNTMVTILACGVSFGGYVSGLFGMNLDNTEYLLPVPNVFALVCGGTLFCILIFSYLAWSSLQMGEDSSPSFFTKLSMYLPSWVFKCLGRFGPVSRRSSVL